MEVKRSNLPVYAIYTVLECCDEMVSDNGIKPGVQYKGVVEN